MNDSGLVFTLLLRPISNAKVNDFSGDAELHFSINTTGTDSSLHLFVSEDWKDAAGDINCHRRLAKAREISKG